MIAAVAAIAFSAFTPDKQSRFDDLWFYYNSSFTPYDGDDCGDGSAFSCSVDHPSPTITEQVPLYFEPELNEIYRVKYGFAK